VTYAVKEIYVTLQGEGAQTGARAVFLRFAGCNLWSGREADRATAMCRFCDTDFVGVDGPGGGRFVDAASLAAAVEAAWGHGSDHRLTVITGGEPTLQLDPALVAALRARGFRVAVETNGTLLCPEVDWLCVSPKEGTEVVQRQGDELKLVYPQPGLMPDAVEQWAFARRFLQPMDGPGQAENIAAAAAYCLANPRWRLSLQTHKWIGLP
jgi:7-carboxy-7-deazaguanine synthase (Cx14CxxC type)